MASTKSSPDIEEYVPLPVALFGEGDIVAALVDNHESTLKTLYRDPEGKCIILHPENSTMEDIRVKDCVIQGVAVNVIKSLKRH